MEDAEIVRGAGGLELERAGFALFVEPLQRPFVGPGVDLLTGQILAAPRGDEEEDVVGRRAEPPGQGEDAGELGEVLRVTVVLTWNSSPAARSAAIPARAPSKAPGT